MQYMIYHIKYTPTPPKRFLPPNSAEPVNWSQIQLGWRIRTWAGRIEGPHKWESKETPWFKELFRGLEASLRAWTSLTHFLSKTNLCKFLL
jgi:hypothetical protein